MVLVGEGAVPADQSAALPSDLGPLAPCVCILSSWALGTSSDHELGLRASWLPPPFLWEQKGPRCSSDTRYDAGARSGAHEACPTSRTLSVPKGMLSDVRAGSSRTEENTPKANGLPGLQPSFQVKLLWGSEVGTLCLHAAP